MRTSRASVKESGKRAAPQRAVRHHQALEHRPPQCPTGVRSEPGSPGPGRSRPVPHSLAGSIIGDFIGAWRSLIEFQAEGRARSIGVSNFGRRHLQHLIDETGVVPAVGPGRTTPLLPTARTTRLVHNPQHSRGSLEPPGPRRHTPNRPSLHRHSRRTRPNPGANSPPLEHPTRHSDHPQVSHPVTNSREHRHLQFRADRREMQSISTLDRPNGRLGPDRRQQRSRSNVSASQA